MGYPYADQTAIQMAAGGAARLLELCDWDANGVLDADVLAQAQASADALIDEYLRKRYTTPLAVPSPTIVRISAAEAVFWLRSCRGPMAMTDLDLELRKQRLAELKGIADGELRPDEPLPAKSTAVRSAVLPLGGDITRDGLKGMW